MDWTCVNIRCMWLSLDFPQTRSLGARGGLDHSDLTMSVWQSLPDICKTSCVAAGVFELKGLSSPLGRG